MTDLERARVFAAHIAERGYPRSGAIETYGASYAGDDDHQAWQVGSILVRLEPEGVNLYA